MAQQPKYLDRETGKPATDSAYCGVSQLSLANIPVTPSGACAAKDLARHFSAA